MRNSGVLLYQSLLPGISNFTLRMRYYGYYCWVSGIYARRGVTSDFEAWRIYEMHRLTQRQFKWQRGFANMPRFYRAAHLFCEGEAAAYFQKRTGCAVPAFLEAGFYLFTGFANSPTRTWRNHAPPEGVTSEPRERVLDRISSTPQAAVREARQIRVEGDHIGCKLSVLRRRPVLRFGATGEDAMAPLPPLILQHITSGLYFDIVEGGGTIWADVGQRFEGYCLRYLAAMLPEYSVEPEYRYGPKGRGFDAPDTLVSQADNIRLVVEYKAKRMPVDARFSGDPVGDASTAMRKSPRAFSRSGDICCMRGAGF